MAQAWLDFWNGTHRIYVNDRHRRVHYDKVAADIAALVPRPDAVVVDWGCGDALAAEQVARACGELVLCDAAENTRRRVAARVGGEARIRVVSPEELARDYAGRVDLMVVNSVLQYLDEPALGALLRDAKALLRPGGRLVVADVIPPEDDLVGDVRNLLATGWRHGFVLAALGGLAAMFFSPYRKLRAEIGLARHGEAELLARLAAAGFRAERLRPNLGFDQRRMAFSATKA
ncbi:class I SAM-dependent methyltransferase [Prosthecomicrobium sp. N25]|uniref:class I SAM-dependent methyltransferase n=1 Tax=Prosthecomicrobium sp. N25 TaxID=3129254 RepID=UPI003077AC23